MSGVTTGALTIFTCCILIAVINNDYGNSYANMRPCVSVIQSERLQCLTDAVAETDGLKCRSVSTRPKPHPSVFVCESDIRLLTDFVATPASKILRRDSSQTTGFPASLPKQTN